MYSVSDNYKTYIKKSSRSFESKITIGTRTFDNNDIIQIVPQIAQPNNGFSIGNTISQSMEITLKNDGGVYASVGTVDVEIGLKIGDSIEYIPLGVFNIDIVTKTDYTVKLTCYDNMYLLETAYTSSVDTPTLAQVMADITSLTGVEFEGTLPSYTVTKLSGYTCREVLAYVASACGGSAYINRDGKIAIVIPSEVDCTVTAANFFNTGYTLEDTTYTIGKITCQNNTNTTSTSSDDYDSVDDDNTISVGDVTADTMELTFENPWVTTSILNDIYNKLNGFSYLGYTLKWQGDLALDPMDIITVVDKNNVSRKALIFANKLTYTGALTAETSAVGETKNSNSFSSSGSSTADIERLSVQLLIAQKAIINTATITDLQATNARVSNLEASVATIDTALINYATITQLDAVTANVATLNASVANIDSALINKANVVDLNATNATIASLDATVGNIQTLINGNLTSANIQSLVLTASKVTVDDGFIKNAMIESLDATKITTGSLNTGKVSVTSSDGSLLIAGATQQFKDSSGNVRLQLGQDAKGNFDFILVASDGTTTLIDGTGVHANAIADGLIRTDMIADEAVTSEKIDYESVFSGFNADTNTTYINSSKVMIDLQNQTLDVAFNQVVNNTTNNTTSINAIQGQISTLISNTTVTVNGTTEQLKDAYNSTVATVNSLSTTIGQHTSEINANTGNITSINSNITSIQASLSSISASLSSTQSTVTSQGTQITTANNNISTLNTNVSNVTSRVSSLELTTSGLTTRVGNTETAISSLNIGGRNLLFHTNKTFTALLTGNTFVVMSGDLAASFTRDYTGLLLENGQTYTIQYDYSITNYISGVGFGLGSGLSIGIYDQDTFATIQPYSYYGGASGKVVFTFTYNKTDTRYLAFRSMRIGSGNDSNTMTISIANLKVEKGNQATDWTPAPEDVDSSIASVKDYATQTINSNVSTINQTTDSIKASVQSLQSSVSTINTTLGNKADTTTVTNVTNRVSTLESSVSGINASITTLNSNVSSVTTTANNAQSAINNLSIGGRNLLLNSNSCDCFVPCNYSSANWTGTTIDAIGETGITKKVRRAYKTTGGGDFRVNASQNTGLVANRTFTFSVWVKSNISNTNLNVNFMLGGTTSDENMTSGVTLTIYPDKWIKYTYTKTYASNTTSNSIRVYMNCGTNPCDILLSDAKLEEGNRATDWTPAPEDVEQEITTTNSNVSSLQSSVSVLQSQISLKVEQTDIDSAISTVNGQIASTNATISSMQSSIDLQLNSITSSVSQKIGNANLLQNSSFEDINAFSMAVTNGSPTKCGIVAYSTEASSMGFIDSTLSTNIFTVQKMSGAISLTDVYTYTNLYVNVTPGKTYTISYYHAERGTISSFSSYLHTLDSSGNEVSHVSINPSSMSGNTWSRYSMSWTCPSGVYKIQFRFGFICSDSAWMFIDNVQVEEGTTLTDWAASTVDVVGTMVTQSPTSVMDAFNGISKYFQVSADGATFGDTSTGDYTTVSNNGLKHHIGSSNYDYLYVNYSGTVYFYGSTSVTTTIPSNILAMLNGRIPKITAFIAQASVYGQGMISQESVGVSSYDPSTGTIKFTGNVQVSTIQVDSDITESNGYYTARNTVEYQVGLSGYGYVGYILTA